MYGWYETFTYRDTQLCWRQSDRMVRHEYDLIGCLMETTPAWFAKYVSSHDNERNAELLARRRTIFIPTSVENAAPVEA
jgi:hypothetical protein